MPKKSFYFILTGLLISFFLTGLFTRLTAFDQQDVYDPHKKIPVEQLKEDFKILRLALEEGHGGLYRYTSKEEMDKYFDTFYASLNQPLAEIEFYQKLLPLIAAVNDGHTRISMSSPYRKYLEKHPNIIPFKFVFFNEKPYLFRNYSEHLNLSLGQEVISINETPADEILEALLKVIPSDAHIQTSKFRKLENPALFSDLYTILFGLTTSFQIVLNSDKKTDQKTIQVPGTANDMLMDIAKKRYPNDYLSSPPISLEYRDSIPILTIKTFGEGSYKRSKISYPDFLKNTFFELSTNKSENLIIDLRDNGGGSDEYGKILTAYLLDKPFLYYRYLETKNTQFSFLDYTNIPPNRRTMPPESFRKNERGWYDALGHPNLGEQNPLKPVFKGRVFILINGGSFSATGECTSIIHYHKRAVFVGEECGAGYYGNTSGFMPIVTLPNTGIRINIPLIRYTMAVDNYPPDRGIIPDYLVKPSIEDLLKGRDSVLEFTLELIKK